MSLQLNNLTIVVFHSVPPQRGTP